MAAGDTLRRITAQDQLIVDVNGNVVGLKSPNANGSDLRFDPSSVAITGGTIGGVDIKGYRGALPNAKTHVLIFGSSNAYGQGASSFANSWAGLLTSAYAATHVFTDVAIPGPYVDYWLDFDVNGNPVTATTYSRFEQYIAQYSPDIVIGSFTLQNGIVIGNQSSAYLSGIAQGYVAYIKKAIAICRARGVKYVAITPYNSSTYTALNQDFNLSIGNQVARLGVDVIDSASIWGYTGTIPPAIYDSGDGLHLNDAGHLAQRRGIPDDVLWLKHARPDGPIRLPSVDTGFLMPNDVVTDGPVTTSSFPLDNFSLGFHVKTPAAFAVVNAVGITASSQNWRLRNPAGAGVFVFTADGVDVAVGTLVTSTEYRIDLTYNAATKTATTYLNGVQAGQAVGLTTGIGAATALTLGGRVGGASANAVGYRFRNLTMHQTMLLPEEIRRMNAGDVSRRSLLGVWPLDDATGRQAGGMFAQLYGGSVALNTAIALA